MIENKFPYEIFPYEIIRLLEDAEKTLNYPIQYFASSILSAVSVSIGNTYKAKLMNHFLIKANLFIAIVGRAGDVKTHPLKMAFNPIDKMDKESFEEYQIAINTFNGLSKDDRKDEDKPKYKKYILKDFTPESMTKTHAVNKKGIVILSDELFGWINNFGRYSNSSEQETYLSLWTGESISIDRKGDEPIRLDDTYLNIIGTMQTKLIPKLAKDNRGDNGFIDRFLFVLNDKPKPILWNEDELDDNNINNYEKMILRLLSLEYDNFKSNIIPFSDEARNHLIAWQNNLRNKYFNDDLGNALSSKYDQYSARFSLIIQLMFWALDDKVQRNEIELFAVEKAILLTEYFLNNAFKVNDMIYNVNPEVNLSQIEKELFQSLTSVFTTKEILVKGEKLELTERTIKRFLNNKKLFIKVKHGKYKKYNS